MSFIGERDFNYMVKFKICRLVAPAGFSRPKKKIPKSFFGVLMSYFRAGKKGNGPNRSCSDLKRTKSCTFIAIFFLPVGSSMI